MDPMQWLLRNRYGSLELSRQVGSNLLRGLIGSVVLHGLMMAALFATVIWNGTHQGRDVSPPSVVDISPHPIFRPMPPIVHDLVKPTPPNPGSIPVPVIDEAPVDPTAPLVPTKPGVPGPADAPGTGTGDLPSDPGFNGMGIPVDETIPDWTVFVAHEVEPSPLSTNLQPAYPELAKISGVNGKVLARMWVNAHGDVSKWEIVQVNPKGLGFEEEVANVISKWKFAPALQQGKPVGVWVAVPFAFKCR